MAQGTRQTIGYHLTPYAREHWFVAGAVADACEGEIVHGNPAAAATAIATDSRKVRPGHGFFALVGANHDGHDYLADAEEKGASLLIVEKHPDAWRPAPGVTVVKVRHTSRALLALASWHRSRLRATVAAVTGSFGKSTVKNMLGGILRARGTCTVAPASFNNRIGVASTLLAAVREDRYVVTELGTNHPGEITELARAVRPDLGLITGIGHAHLDGLGGVEGVREAKAELIPYVSTDGVLLLNADDARCASLADRFPGRIVTFGEGESAQVRACDVRAAESGWEFRIDGQSFRLNVAGRHNVLNAVAAVAAAQALGVTPEQTAEALREVEMPAMRFEVRQIAGVRFVLDCYNSNPSAMRTAVRSFMQEPCSGRRIVVCADMLELGKHEGRLHRETGAMLVEAGVDLLLAVGPLGHNLLEGWEGAGGSREGGLHCPSAEAAACPLMGLMRPGDSVLLKGSRAMALERTVELITERLAAEEAA